MFCFALGKEMPHPAVQIYIWICLALLVQMLHGYLLLLLAASLLAFAFTICRERLLALLLRTRWIFISVLIIYAYSSPGQALWPQLGVLSPVADGVVAGLMQALGLSTMLAGLAILLTLLSQSQLVAGLYTLSAPLHYLGLERERIAVRLALVLDYAERVMQDTAKNWRGSIEHLLAPQPGGPGYIDLHVVPFSRRDWMLFAAVSAALFGVWL